jgi:hypothetical protein
MDPEIRPLTVAESEALEAGLNLASRLADAPQPLRSDQIEALYNLIYGSDVRKTDHIIAVGLAFGDELLRHGAFEWVRVIDDYGDETCVAIRGLSVYCAPISMIQKRLSRGELPDFVELRKATISSMEDMVTTKTEERDW